MSMYSPVELKSEFREIVHFATYLCSVLVKEVRHRQVQLETRIKKKNIKIGLNLS